MPRLRQVARNLIRHLWHAAAVAVIVLAVAITLLRLLLPAAQDYRDVVADWASERLGQPVTVASLDARLEDFSPVLVLKELSLRDPDGGEPIARFREALIAFDLIGSIRRGVPMVRRLTVVGAELTVERDTEGRLALHGLDLPVDGPVLADTPGKGAAWLLAQGDLAIREGRLRWVDRQLNLPPAELYPVDIRLHNTGSHHRFEAVASGGSERLRLVGEVRGNPLAVDWSGQVFLEARGLDAGRWAKGLRVGAARISDGTVATRLWTEWESARLVAAEGEANLFGLRLRQGARQIDFERISAKGRFTRSQEGWRLALRDTRIRRAGHTRDLARVEIGGSKTGAIRLLADGVQLEDVAELGSVAASDEALVEALIGVQPRGWLERVRIERGPDHTWHAQAVVTEFRNRAWGQFPGIENFSGRFAWSGQQGELHLDSERSGITLPHLFPQRLDLGRVAGRATVTHDGGWRIEARDLRVSSDDIELVSELVLRLPESGSPHLELSGKFWNGRAAAVAYFLPVRVMNPNATQWLGNAFHAGTVTSGTVEFDGALEDFPFDHEEGRFEIRFHARGVELHYQEGWPNFLGADAEVLFRGRRMEIDASAARLFNGRVERARVGIPDLQHPYLDIAGEARTPARDLLRLIGETPLREHVSAYLYDGVALDGDARLALEMRIPLVDAVKAEHPFTVSGHVDFDEARLRLTEAVTIEQLVGRLDFTEQGVASPGLTGRFAGGPVSATVGVRHDGQETYTRIQAEGRADSGVLAEQFDSALSEQLSGELAWTGDVTVPQGAQGVALSVRADLGKSVSALPHPLEKQAGEPLHAAVHYVLNGERAGETSIMLGDRLTATLKGGGNGIERAHVHFGREMAQLPDRPLLRFTGSLDRFAPAEWAALRASRVLPAEQGPPWRVEVAMERLELEGKAGQEVSVPTADSGTLTRRLASLDVDIGQFSYGAGPLGSLRLLAERKGEALDYTNLRLAGDHFELSGTGKTVLAEDDARTDWQVRLTSSDVGQMLAAFGFASVVKRGRGSVDARLEWPGEPGDYTLAATRGEIELEMHEGAFQEVEPGAGKMIGLFSLDAIPRRLRLDFRDLTDEGLAFHEVKGTLRLHDGNVFTSDLHVDAPAAKMVITGRTGLVARDYDNLVTVVPNVADTLPVAGGLALGPQVGAALLILRQIFKSQIDASAAYHYRVTGPWESPELARVSTDTDSGQP